MLKQLGGINFVRATDRYEERALPIPSFDFAVLVSSSQVSSALCGQGPRPSYCHPPCDSPALFAVIHGARIYHSRGILVFATLCLGVGALFESMSLRTGFPFGYYRFTDLMGPLHPRSECTPDQIGPRNCRQFFSSHHGPEDRSEGQRLS
jgi:hypothetical protein